MIYFSKEYLDFFKKLAANNNKDWFDANRGKYEEFVKIPFERFIGDLIKAIGKIDKNVKIAPKDAIFRINRDVRFGADKSPYKTTRSAVISRFGKKDISYPGIYLEAGPEHYRVYGGCHQPEKDQLANIRSAIAANPGKLDKLLVAPDFKKVFGKILGEKNKIIPKELKEAADKSPLIYNKNFYWYCELPADAILKKDILEKSVTAYKVGKPLQDYFSASLK